MNFDKYEVITPNTWGPLLWNFLHCIPFELTKKNANNFIMLFKKLSYMIPCNICREHYNNFYDKYPLNKSNILDLKIWVLNLHNNINKNLNKIEYTLDKSNKTHKKINNISFLNFIIIFLNSKIDKEVDMLEYLNIKLFFNIISDIYPNKNIKNKFREVEDNIFNIYDLKKWFYNYIEHIKLYQDELLEI